MSLRRRLALLTVGVFAAGLTVLVLVVPALVRGFLTDRLDDEIVSASQFAAGVVTIDLPDQGPFGSRGGDDRQPSLLDEVYAELRDLDGVLIRGRFLDPNLGERSIPALAALLVVEVERPFTVGSVGDAPPARWRVSVFDLFDRSGTRSASLVVAVPMTTVDDTVSQVVRITLLTGAVTLGAVGLLAWWLIGFGLRPLKRMERSAAAIADADDLARRVDHPSTKTELGRLGSTVNHMLERLEKSFSAQRETERRLRRFAADASHELRTPLTSIRGYAELFRHGVDDPEQVARNMVRIEEESARMNRLVEDLLLLARSDEGLSLASEPVELSAVVSGLVDDLRVVAGDREITLLVEPCTIIGDRHRLTQAVANLLTNARTHTPAGSPLAVSVRIVGGAAVIEVVDHGRGLAADELERIFDRFYRVDTSRRRRERASGSGLGLSITDAIVRAHNGVVSAGATPGGGATFTIRLPLAAPPV